MSKRKQKVPGTIWFGPIWFVGIFLLLCCQHAFAFPNNQLVVPENTSLQPGVDPAAHPASSQETSAVPDPQGFWNPSPLAPSEPSPEEIKPPDQNSILSSIEKESVREKFDDLAEILLEHRAYKSMAVESAATEQRAAAKLENNDAKLPAFSGRPEHNQPLDRMIGFFKDRFEETRGKFREGGITPDFFVQAVPALANLKTLRNAITLPGKEFAGNENHPGDFLNNTQTEEAWDRAMNFAVMNSLIHPPPDLHPFVRALFSQRFVSQGVFRDYLSALDNIRLQHRKILMILSERTDKTALSGHLKNDLAGGVLEALAAKILRSR